MYAILKTIKTQTLLENQFMGPEIVYRHARPQPIMAQAQAQPEAAIRFISVPTVQQEQMPTGTIHPRANFIV